jgi:hypothetical protein
MSIRGRAGQSAFRRARELRRAHLLAASKWGSYVGGITVLASGGLFRDVAVSVATGTTAAVGTAVWRSAKPSGAKRWVQGAQAERRTGRALKPMTRYGWRVHHDLRVPRSKANLDHVLVPPSGEFLVYIDTKAWHMKSSNGTPAAVTWDGRRLMYGNRFDNTPKLRTVEWEAERLAAETGMRVIPVIAVEGARVSDLGICVDDVRVVSVNNLIATLHGLEATRRPNNRQSRSASRVIELKFVAA